MIKTVICDVDGCLNDGKQAHVLEFSRLEIVTSFGDSTKYDELKLNKLYKTFHSRDKTAIRALIAQHIRVIIVSADDSEITKAWVESCGAEFFYTPIIEGQKDISALGEIDWSETVGIGDDVIDLSYLEKCKRAYCPKDANVRLKSAMKTIKPLDVKGGEGVIDELLWRIEFIIQLELDQLKINAAH